SGNAFSQVALDTTPEMMRDQHHRPRRAKPARPSQRVGVPACRRQRIAVDELLRKCAVPRMQTLEHLRVAAHELPPRATERGARRMSDERAERGDMPPAQPRRTKAPIVFLAITLGEQLVAEQADIGQAI